MDEEVQEPPSLHDLLHQTALDRQEHTLNLGSDDSVRYIDHLVALTLPSLVKEPTLISAETSAVESELTNLCYREYSTFLSVHQCSSAVKTAFDDFQGSLDLLLGSVPDLETQCREFTRKAQPLTTSRARSLLVQDHQDKLLDLLELPQLMETCARNGYYQEAMDLSNHAKDLRDRYPDVRLIADVAKEVDNVTQLILAQLLNLLREPVKLATAVKTVTYLRRLEMLDETSLGLAFLSGRLHNFRIQLLQIEKDRADPVRYLRKYIDHFREHVYDILSQFTAVFDDYDILVSFAGQCAADMVQLVANYIPRISSDPASMSSILIQLGYCSLSFARIGLEFGLLISAPFAETVQTVYGHAITLAGEKLSNTLHAATESRSSPIDAIIDPDQRATVLSQVYPTSATDTAPLVSPFPPLALFVNEHLAALNALRMLAPVESAPRLEQMLSISLKETTGVLAQFIGGAADSEKTGRSRPPKHNRTPSSPRAHLFRRNTETQLSPAARAAKKRETDMLQRALVNLWSEIVLYLRSLQSKEIFARVPSEDPALGGVLRQLSSSLSPLAVDEVPNSPITSLPPADSAKGASSLASDTLPPVPIITQGQEFVTNADGITVELTNASRSEEIVKTESVPCVKRTSEETSSGMRAGSAPLSSESLAIPDGEATTTDRENVTAIAPPPVPLVAPAVEETLLSAGNPGPPQAINGSGSFATPGIIGPAAENVEPMFAALPLGADVDAIILETVAGNSGSDIPFAVTPEARPASDANVPRIDKGNGLSNGAENPPHASRDSTDAAVLENNLPPVSQPALSLEASFDINLKVTDSTPESGDDGHVETAIDASSQSASADTKVEFENQREKNGQEIEPEVDENDEVEAGGDAKDVIEEGRAQDGSSRTPPGEPMPTSAGAKKKKKKNKG